MVARTYSPTHLPPTSHVSFRSWIWPELFTRRTIWKRPAVMGQAARGDQGSQVGRQAHDGYPATDLGRGQTVEGRWSIMQVIPVPKERGLALDMREVAKAIARPKAFDPQAVKGLDLVIALGLVYRGEPGFDAAKQTQAHDLADNLRMGVPSAKRTFVVELLQKRQPQFGPCFQQMGAGREAGLIRVLGQPNGVTVMVDGMKNLDGVTVAHVARDDV